MNPPEIIQKEKEIICNESLDYELRLQFAYQASVNELISQLDEALDLSILNSVEGKKLSETIIEITKVFYRKTSQEQLIPIRQISALEFNYQDYLSRKWTFCIATDGSILSEPPPEANKIQHELICHTGDSSYKGFVNAYGPEPGPFEKGYLSAFCRVLDTGINSFNIHKFNREKDQLIMALNRIKESSIKSRTEKQGMLIQEIKERLRSKCGILFLLKDNISKDASELNSEDLEPQARFPDSFEIQDLAGLQKIAKKCILNNTKYIIERREGGGYYLAVELFLRESGKLAGAFLVQFDEKPGHNTIHLALQAADEIDDFLIFNREMLEEVQLREKIMNVLIPMIGEDQSKFILSAHDPKKLSQPQQKYAIIMFSDLKGSTRTADVLMSRGKEIFEKYKNHRESPEYIDELVKLEKLTENYVKYINFYLGLSSRSVLKFGGVVDKYIGDAVMAAWGVPIDAPDPIFIARRAILATVFANRMTLKYNESMKQEGFEDLFIFQQRFVLHCGEVLAGIFGTPLRFDYTIMGAPVNEAARIESLETSAPGKVTFSREFYNLVNDFIEADHLGSFKLKGKENPIDIYRFKKFRNSNISEIAEEYIDRSKISISHAEDENFKDYLRDDWDID